MAWDFPGTFTRVGNLSPAWQVVPNFTNRAKGTPPAAVQGIRMHLDSGDSGTSSDNYWLTYGFRDNWVGGSPAKFALGSSLWHVVGFGQQHNEAAWAARLPGALAFLYPAAEEPNDVLRSVIGPHWDASSQPSATVDDIDLEDLLAVNAGQGQRDINLDGLVNADDAAPVERFIRRNETSADAGRQR